jgi:hypothetical protein
MNNVVTTNTNTNVVVVTAPGPAGVRGPIGPQGNTGTISGNTGINSTGSSILSGSVNIIGTLSVTGSTSFLGTALLNGAPILTAATLATDRIATTGVTASVSTGNTVFTVSSASIDLFKVTNTGTSGSFIGAFSGSGANLFNIPASGITGLNLSQIASTTATASISAASGFQVNTNTEITGSLKVTAGVSGSFSGSFQGNGSGLTNVPASGIVGLNLSQVATGSVSASVTPAGNVFTVQSSSAALMTVSSSGYVSASGFIGDGSRLSNVGIIYNSGSNPLINSIQVADFDNNVAVTYINGNLKFIFGTPTPPSTPSISLSGFATDRFNKVSDSYNTLASWDVGGYTLTSAKLYYTVTGQLLDSTTTGTSFNVIQATTGSSQTYRVDVTSSSPLDGAISQQTSTTTGTLSKSRPDVPSISISSNTVQLGISSNQIEEGATGDLNFSAAYGAANAWEEVTLTTTPSSSPQTVSSPTSAVSISATSNYQSPAGTNDPQIFDSRTTTTTYSRIRSLRYGASTAVSFTEADLQDLEIWDTGLGGTIGTIAKGTVNPSGQSLTITWTGDKYHYIIISTAYTLSNITTGGFGVLGAFTATAVGNYRVYKSNTLQSGGAGTSITYVLT